MRIIIIHPDLQVMYGLCTHLSSRGHYPQMLGSMPHEVILSQLKETGFDYIYGSPDDGPKLQRKLKEMGMSLRLRIFEPLESPVTTDYDPMKDIPEAIMGIISNGCKETIQP